MNAADPNPYAAPAADVNSGVLVPAADGRPATRAARFFASVLDGLLYFGTWLLIVVGFVVTVGGKDRSRGDWVGVAMIVAGILAFLVLLVFQIYRVSTTGQTLGKKWLDIRIVKIDGQPVTFGTAFVLRSLVPGLLQAVPYLGTAFGLVDVLFIFREDRRCIHDLIAGTRVVDVEPL